MAILQPTDDHIAPAVSQQPSELTVKTMIVMSFSAQSGILGPLLFVTLAVIAVIIAA